MARTKLPNPNVDSIANINKRLQDEVELQLQVSKIPQERLGLYDSTGEVISKSLDSQQSAMARRKVHDMVVESSTKINQPTFDPPMILSVDPSMGVVLSAGDSPTMGMSSELQLGDPEKIHVLLAIVKHLAISMSDELVKLILNLTLIIDKDKHELEEGKKTHLSILYEANGFIHIYHISLSSLLAAPISNITDLELLFMLQGVKRTDSITMVTTSPEEASSLSTLDGGDFSELCSAQSIEEVTRKALSAVNKPLELTALARKEVLMSELQFIAEGLRRDSRSSRFETEQFVQLMKAIVIIVTSRNAVINVSHDQNQSSVQLSSTGVAPLFPSMERDASIRRSSSYSAKHGREWQETIRSYPYMDDDSDDAFEPPPPPPTDKVSKDMLFRRYDAFTLKTDKIRRDLDKFDDYYYQDEASYNAIIRFKSKINTAIVEYKQRLLEISNTEYPNNILLDQAIDAVGRMFHTSCTQAYDSLKRESNLDYEVGIASYLLDCMRLILNIAAWVGNTVSCGTARFQFFDYISSKSAKVETESLQLEINTLGVTS